MPNSDTLLTLFLENNNFKDYRDKRIASKINKKFSLSDFTDIQLIESNLERDAKQGDPFSLAMLGKIYYDRGGSHKSIAFNYFDAAVKKGNHYLANAVANYVSELGNKIKYHRHAIEISKGKSESASQLWWLKDGYFHRKIIELTLDQDLKRTKSRLIVSGTPTTKTDWDWKHEGVVEEFIKFSHKSPERFKELCITCSRQQVENALEDKGMADAYFKQFQRDLADKVLTAQKQAKYKKKAQDVIIKEFASAYHPDYQAGLEDVIEAREKEIENTSEYVLQQMNGLVLAKIKELLFEMRAHLDESSEDQEENKDALTVEEINLLKQINSSTSSQHGQVADVSKKLVNLIKNYPNIRSICLQLQAFFDIGEKLGIAPSHSTTPSVSPEYVPKQRLSSSELPQSGSKDAKYPNTQKLHDIVVAIQDSNSRLEQKIKSQVKPFKWVEFIKVVLAACSLVGIGFMLQSSHVYGTHKFWSSRKQTESKPSKIEKQAATKAKKSLFQVVGHHAEKAANELPSLKAASGHRKVGKG